ncbi:probable asparagine--tRNA ligase, mitochondrial isoform X2 [Osmia bicornis bicornis]|uniref:probable asparagine--tRNA ligase, mitochondrial isoform X2 n=1 Tax=Osmia bicornis bicornis TaxID=1437191 RepID=UPI001EAF82D3|nr:probable asparagine--tRNA ligase, mitochondrial isoform X2 [Osmia bicornis bicornis]
MSLKMFSKFNRSLLLANFNFPKCHVHSMLRIHDTDLESNAGKLIKVQGWVRALRKMKNNIFIDITDGSTAKMLQVVLPTDNKPDNLSYGSSITAEGAGELFLVKPSSEAILKAMKREDVTEEESYFNTKTFLTVSGQLHLEAVARALTKVYTFGPTFRAENSKSRLHLSEFRMLEAELAFINSIDDIMDEVELLIKNITKDILEKGASDIHEMKCPEVQWLNENFTRMTYDEAINILQNNEKSFQQPVTLETGISKEHELFLVKHNNNVPIFVINWPKESKPFYMKECENDASKVAAMDLLVPIVGELVGGSIREDDYEKLKSKLPVTSNLSWYLELRKYGNVTTGGFGMGFERFLQCLFDIPNIKDTLPFPRWPHNCSL